MPRNSTEGSGAAAALPRAGPEPELSRVFTRAFSTAEVHRPSIGPTATVNLNGAVTIDTPVFYAATKSRPRSPR